MSLADASRLVAREPGAIPASAVVLKLWGDDDSGRVNDEIFISNEMIQQMRFTMPPGARFTHSPAYRTAMGADEVYHVLRGRLALANPETGEVRVAGAGEAVAFGRDTWHHGFSEGDEALDVMQYFAPPPATGSSQAYARNRPFLEHATYEQDDLLQRWPEAVDDAAGSAIDPDPSRGRRALADRRRGTSAPRRDLAEHAGAHLRRRGAPPWAAQRYAHARRRSRRATSPTGACTCSSPSSR